MSLDDDDDLGGHDDESPWISFSDAMSALLFIFITTTFWFMIQLQEIRARLTRQAEVNEQENRKLTGAERAAQALIGDVKLCLEESEAGDLKIRPVIDASTRTMSIYLEPASGTGGEWFAVCSAAATPDAVLALNTMRRCLAREVPALADTYGVTLVLEGHTDARATGGACGARFPSNWELSGARAGGALRRLLCEDGRCDDNQDAEAAVLRRLAEESAKLQVVAAGRADSVPAWTALCDPTWPGATVDPALDAAVCAELASGPGGRARAADRIRAATGILGAPRTSTDESLIGWANADACVRPMAKPPGACVERLGRLRRVDLRVDLKPRADTAVGGAGARGRP